jgi:hypothetical protein
MEKAELQKNYASVKSNVPLSKDANEALTKTANGLDGLNIKKLYYVCKITYRNTLTLLLLVSVSLSDIF